MCQRAIANIDISKEYDESMGSNDVHYQSFARMADFFVVICRRIATTSFFKCTFLIPGRLSYSSTIIAIRCRRRYLCLRRPRCRMLYYRIG